MPTFNFGCDPSCTSKDIAHWVQCWVCRFYNWKKPLCNVWSNSVRSVCLQIKPNSKVWTAVDGCTTTYTSAGKSEQSDQFTTLWIKFIRLVQKYSLSKWVLIWLRPCSIWAWICQVIWPSVPHPGLTLFPGSDVPPPAKISPPLSGNDHQR